MAKGTEAKNEVFTKVMSLFPDCFMYNDNKELRINLTEAGEPVQIKLTLTCAKIPVTPAVETTPVNNNEMKNVAVGEFNWSDDEPAAAPIIEPTTEEKENVARLVKSLGL